ncbi:MAG: hypothetical protein BWY68_00325 [bacterium ADurb.Bin400]|nr:MAG: hypothetical protein BWY68_00325 [bacterium ADurb.Bin400]
MSSLDDAHKDIANTTTQNKKQNLHTLYWNMVFTNPNQFKLNGEAEMFLRKASLENKETIKTQKNSRTIEHGIKNKRYTEDKFLFHVPIKLNFCREERRLNNKVNSAIASNFDNLHVIGIDRGEKHLAYYSVIDTKGNIVEQGTLNSDLQGQNYAEKLENLARQRDEARKSWQEIGTIKELKDGYVSQVVRRIADLVIKYNGIVVLEDLNTGFKRGRQKIEKSVYQKLELALAKKLNFLVDKSAQDGEVGSPSRALQLTPLINNFGEMEKWKQWGVLFYTRAAYTSITDPITGFRKNIFLPRDTVKSMREAILNFDGINYDQTKNAYYFTYDPSNFKGNKCSSQTWTIYSCVDRIINKRNKESGKWESHPINATEKLNDLLASHNINKNLPILPQIEARNDLPGKFYEELIWCINLILQLRNSDSSNNTDFIQSPVEPFFNSRIHEKTGRQSDGKDIANLPTCGDANGAYNIARKGLIMLKKIRQNPEKPDLFVSDEEWDQFNHMSYKNQRNEKQASLAKIV